MSGWALGACGGVVGAGVGVVWASAGEIMNVIAAVAAVSLLRNVIVFSVLDWQMREHQVVSQHAAIFLVPLLTHARRPRVELSTSSRSSQ
jgi:hypothetical protein